MANTRVVLTGDIPSKQELMARRETGKDQDDDKAADKKVADKKDTDKEEANKKVANATRRRRLRPTRVVRDIPRVGRGWREYHEGGRTYYYRDRPARGAARLPRRVYRVYRRPGAASSGEAGAAR